MFAIPVIKSSPGLLSEQRLPVWELYVFSMSIDIVGLFADGSLPLSQHVLSSQTHPPLQLLKSFPEQSDAALAKAGPFFWLKVATARATVQNNIVFLLFEVNIIIFTMWMGMDQKKTIIFGSFYQLLFASLTRLFLFFVAYIVSRLSFQN